MNIKKLLIGKQKISTKDLIIWTVLSVLLVAYKVDLEPWGYFLAFGSIIVLIIIALNLRGE